MTADSIPEQRRILVLGASKLQAPALSKAREMGYRVGVVDRDPDAFGVPLADDFFEVSTTDVEGVVAVAREYDPVGVLTLGTDMPMRAVSGVADILGLVAPAPDAIIPATDKGEMARAFARADVAAPRSVTLDSDEELVAAVAGWPLPYVFKPVDNAGSRGVVLAHAEEDLQESFLYSQSQSGSGRVIVQEFLRGHEVSVEGFCLADEVHVVTITDKLTTSEPHFVEMGHSQPSQLPESDQERIIALTGEAARALGVRDCAVHAEIMLTETGPRMIEFGARLGGDFITTDLVPLSTGVDMVRAIIDLSCGNRPDLVPTKHGASAIRFLAEGVPAEVLQDVLDRVRTIEGVVEVQVKLSGGAGIQSSADRAGYVIATADTPAEAIARCEAALALIREHSE